MSTERARTSTARAAGSPPPPEGGLSTGTKVVGMVAIVMLLLGGIANLAAGPRDRDEREEGAAFERERDTDDRRVEPERAEHRAAPAERRPAPATAGDLPAPDDVAAPPASAVRTESGLASRVLRPGTGTEHPTAASQVRVHYTGWTTDGRMFDSSVTRGEPAEFPLSRVIRGWTEGLQLMVEGEQRRFWIPAELAYGANPRPGAPAGMLVFDVELIDIL